MDYVYTTAHEAQSGWASSRQSSTSPYTMTIATMSQRSIRQSILCADSSSCRGYGLCQRYSRLPPITLDHYSGSYPKPRRSLVIRVSNTNHIGWHCRGFFIVRIVDNSRNNCFDMWAVASLRAGALCPRN